jgi:hypothetical protein
METLGFFEHATRLSGVEMHPDTWLDGRNKRSVLEAQTITMASKLKLGGFDPLRKEAGRMTLVGLCTGQTEQVTQWRHVNILPSVANLNRRSLVKHLGCFVESRPFTRYAVITNGVRCGVTELRERLVELGRAVSNWASRSKREFAVKVYLRASEVTVSQDSVRCADGHWVTEWTYHPHANVLFEPASMMQADKWSEFLRWSHDVLPGHWKECGRLADPKEAVKYPFKPSELECLPPEELAVLAEALHGLKLAQPMGEFLLFQRDLETRGVKLSKVPCRQQGWRWCEVKRLRSGERREDEGRKKAVVDQLVAVLSPRPHFLPRMEPCALVMNFSGDLDAVMCDIKDAIEPALARWKALTSTPARQLHAERATTGGVAARPPPTAACVVPF